MRRLKINSALQYTVGRSKQKWTKLMSQLKPNAHKS